MFYNHQWVKCRAQFSLRSQHRIYTYCTLPVFFSDLNPSILLIMHQILGSPLMVKCEHNECEGGVEA